MQCKILSIYLCFYHFSIHMRAACSKQMTCGSRNLYCTEIWKKRLQAESDKLCKKYGAFLCKKKEKFLLALCFCYVAGIVMTFLFAISRVFSVSIAVKLVLNACLHEKKSALLLWLFYCKKT